MLTVDMEERLDFALLKIAVTQSEVFQKMAKGEGPSEDGASLAEVLLEKDSSTEGLGGAKALSNSSSLENIDRVLSLGDLELAD